MPNTVNFHQGVEMVLDAAFAALDSLDLTAQQRDKFIEVFKLEAKAAAV